MRELYTRVNFFVASVISIMGFTLIYEVISEDDPMDKIDDFLMVVLGVAAIWWYKKIGHKGASSIPAVWISGVAVALKILAVIIEHADKEAVGDDIGILISLIMIFVFVTYLVFFHKKTSK